MGLFDRIAEEKIQAAMRAGVFDNLSGQGKPLKLEEEEGDLSLRLVRAMLAEQNLSLPWIELRREIEAEIAAARQKLVRARQRGYGWHAAVSDFKREVERINRRISLYNLQVPAAAFQRPPLHAGLELDRLTAAHLGD
jgi:DnaJ family protein C protein 28